MEAELSRKHKKSWSGFLKTDDSWLAPSVSGDRGALTHYFAPRSQLGANSPRSAFGPASNFCSWRKGAYAPCLAHVRFCAAAGIRSMTAMGAQSCRLFFQMVGSSITLPYLS
ncbi:hypothetical protein CHELA40_13800 [Chelatococcus asaccharovorans]|nr:hypothetical protein CHELA40_13800 [Chelatococcus asaccharovorans]CAH1675543.1 hypothetical protein CHELA17_61826 [Chelatococcus asaccharovorans]